MDDLQIPAYVCKIALPKVRDQEVDGSNPLAPTNPFNKLEATRHLNLRTKKANLVGNWSGLSAASWSRRLLFVHMLLLNRLPYDSSQIPSEASGSIGQFK
jgi:hypothetical protein